MPVAAYDELFDNHLAFFAAHRGTVTVTQDWARIDGYADFLSSWTPLSELTSLPAEEAAVRLIPQSGKSWGPTLAAVGFTRAESLSYMELPLDRLLPPGAPECAIRQVADDADADAFAQVQSAAFLTDGAPQRDWWIDCFHRVARANYARSDQDFLIAWANGEPAAVLLALDTEKVTGIYAVATAPAHQRRGYSIALLGAARSRALQRGRGRLILQAMNGSYAEGFYSRLGFVHCYRSQVWRRGQ